MSNFNKKTLLINVAEELKCFFDDKNAELKKGIAPTDLDDPDYYDYQTCYDLMVFVNDL